MHIVKPRTRNIIDLIDGESIEIKYTSNQPWTGYNRYIGNYQSILELNTDLPFS